MISASPQTTSGRQDELFGHPKALYVLFFTELWERFNYYGMRALLVLYMVKGLQFTDDRAYEIYGAYTGLVYTTPLIGGLLADRLLGNRRAIILGAILMALGEFVLSVPDSRLFFLALGGLIIGNGFFKPNISTIVGQLYPEGDSRRDSGFTIFYMGINIGAFLAPFVCGTVGEIYGWGWGFLLAGIGMLTGLCIFLKFGYMLGERGRPPKPEKLTERVAGPLNWVQLLYIAIAAAVPLISYLVFQAKFVQVTLYSVAALFIIYIVFEALRGTAEEAGKIFVILILMVFAITFWACFEQAGSSINLFTDRLVNRHFFGWEIPTTWFQSVNPIFITFLGIPFSSLWIWLGRRNLNPSAPLKFALAIFQLALGFAVLVIAARIATSQGKSPMNLLVLAYLFHTTGELCLSPVGLSMVTKLAPARLASVLMGVWFLSSAIANISGGVIATLTTKATGYEGVFLGIVYVALGVSVVLLLITPLLKKLSRGAV